MEYKKHSIGKYSYGTDGVKLQDAVEKDVTNFGFVDDIFVNHMNDKNHPNYQNIVLFLTHLALCHTVVSETKDGKILYNASSPDELALVNAAKYFGVVFKKRDEDNNLVIDFRGRILKYKLLNVLEFNSTRKRMSIII